jgi:hypothetical protein
MIRTRLAAVAAVVLLAFSGAAAANATVAIQVKIYLENNNGNPGTVTVSCGPAGPVLHTALFNDAIGANTVETAKIYREDTGAVVFGPVDVPINGHVNVDMPYLAGVAFNAYAVPKGDPWPTTTADALARLAAKPPTADNSQLFPSGYPAAPVDCKVPPPPNPCVTHPVLDAVAAVVPTCPPCPTPDVKAAAVVMPTPTCTTPPTEPSTEPSTKPSSKPSSRASSATTSSATTSSSSPSTGASSTTGQPAPTPTGSAATTATGGLAHTGATVLPYAAGALVLLAAGGGFVVYTRRARRH